jgi:hypothetical protein
MFQRQGYKTSDENVNSQWADKDLERGYNGLFDGSVCTIKWKKKEQSTNIRTGLSPVEIRSENLLSTLLEFTAIGK